MRGDGSRDLGLGRWLGFWLGSRSSRTSADEEGLGGRELPNLPHEDAPQLVDLYAERGSPKYEMRGHGPGEAKIEERRVPASRFEPSI